MRQAALSWTARASGAIASLIVILAVLYLVRVGLKSGDQVFRRLMDIALVFLVSCAVLELKYKEIVWKDRPEKQWRLRYGKLFIVLLIILSIPMAVINWLR
jgi:hypothetical protein